MILLQLTKTILNRFKRKENYKMNYEFMKKFKPENNTIKEFKYWIVVIREKQITLGSMIIILKREVPSVADMLPEEAAEFPEIVKWFENLTKELYGAEKFNYVIAMMKDSFVHYHAIPRYSKVIHKYGLEWQDSCWPGLIQFKPVKFDDAVIDQIKEDMRNHK